MNNIQQKQTVEISPSGAHILIKSQKKHNLSSHSQDQLFLENLDSIGTDLRTDLNIDWQALQSLVEPHEITYSQGINDLRKTEYCNKSITQCLLIMNWFAQNKFINIFSNRQISKFSSYDFVVLCQGILQRVWVNSKIPLKDNKILFAQPVNGSIFPCLFQKSLAKIYGSYQYITDDLLQLLELWTCYALQIFPTTRHSVREFAQFFQSSLETKNLVLFKTRNSTKLEEMGFPINSWFLISRVIRCSQEILSPKGLILVQFLELWGRNWKGKYSKTSKFWLNNPQLITNLKINILPQSIQNYIQLKDLMDISRQISILHNTTNYHINWVMPNIERNTKNNQCMNKKTFALKITPLSQLKTNVTSHYTLISIHFENACKNWVYLIEQTGIQMMSCSFKNNKNSNLIIAVLQNNTKYLLYVYNQSLLMQDTKINVTVSCETSWCQIQQCQKPFWVEQRAFLDLVKSVNMVETNLGEFGAIKVKNMYSQLGIGFILVHLNPKYKNKIRIQFNQRVMAENKISIFNHINGIERPYIQYTAPCHSILLLFMGGNYQKGDKFPPTQALTVSQIGQDQEIRLMPFDFARGTI